MTDHSISEKISAYSEEIERLSAEIIIEQERLQSLMDDESVSLESIVAYKKDIFSASDAEARIKEIDMEVATLKSQLLARINKDFRPAAGLMQPSVFICGGFQRTRTGCADRNHPVSAFLRAVDLIRSFL